MPKGKELKLVGVDTGFFYSLKEGDQTATILLVGTGLLGIIGFGRKRLNKKA